MAACSLPGKISDDQQALWESRQQILIQFDNWDIHARAALKLEGEAYNIGIRWQRDPKSSKILLEAPFGQGVFRIDSGSDGVYRLHLPDGQVFKNITAEALLEDVIGWSLPISGLEYWIRGMPRPGSDYSQRLREDGRISYLEQDQWTIDYLDHFTQQTPQLPRKIRLVNDTLTLKMIIEHWQRAELDDTPSDLFPDFN